MRRDELFSPEWIVALAVNGQEPVDGGHPVVPYLNHGRWVADCDCNGGMLCREDLFLACCLDCGHVYPIAWPPPSLRARVRELTIRRPLEAQNYDERVGDTLDRLERENVLMRVEAS